MWLRWVILFLVVFKWTVFAGLGFFAVLAVQRLL